MFIWQVKELNASLETEKASRTDLEMYVAVLNTQKNVLTEDADKLRLQLQEGTAIISYCCLLPPASEGWGKVMVSVCLSVHTRGGGYHPPPQLGQDGGGAVP